MKTKHRGFWSWLDFIFPYVLIVLIFLADRLSKLWALDYLAEKGTAVINPLLTVMETYNRGIAFGMFQGVGPIIGWLTVGVVVFMFVVLVKTPQSERLIRWGLALIIGGALGNQMDRLTAGEVLDFIKIPIWNGTLNVADIAINAGMILLLISVFLGYFHPPTAPETDSI